MSNPTSNIESAFVSAVYRACVKVHNHTVDETRQKTERNKMQIRTRKTPISAPSCTYLLSCSSIRLELSSWLSKYLKTEKAEIEEELALERFFKHMPNTKIEKEQHVNQMAIRAFHTLTTSGHGQVARRDLPGERCSIRYNAPDLTHTVVTIDNDPKTLLVNGRLIRIILVFIQKVLYYVCLV